MTKKSTKNTLPEHEAVEGKFDFRTIKTFEDACTKEGIDPTVLPELLMIPVEFRKPLIALYKLLIIFKAINHDWRPDWSNSDQYKFYPWYGVLSSGFGFSTSHFGFGHTCTTVGSRLCTNNSEKAMYIAKQFKAEYQEYLLYPE